MILIHRFAIALCVSLLQLSCDVETRAPGSDFEGTSSLRGGPLCDSDTNECSEKKVCSFAEFSPGCPCDIPGEQVDCGKKTITTTRNQACGASHALCGSDGLWTDCRFELMAQERSGGISAGLLPPHRGIKMGLSPAVDCLGNTCDSYCKEFPDEPSDSLAGGDLLFDNGITVKTEAIIVAANGPASSATETRLSDAGLLPSGPYIYHELIPGGAPSDPDSLELTAELNFIDVYFNIDTSYTMADAIEELGESVAGSRGIIQQVRGTFPNTRFGVGHFHGYPVLPHAVKNSPILPFIHTLNMTSNDSDAEAVIDWLQSNGTTRNRNYTEGFGTALYSLTNGTPSGGVSSFLYRGAGTNTSDTDDSDNFWVRPRNAGGALEWISDYSGSALTPERGPCPAGTVGYACMNTLSTKIVVTMTDDATENGPGGHFSFGHESPEQVATSTLAIPGGSPWPTAIDTDPLLNSVENNAIRIVPSVFSRYTGTFSTTSVGGTGMRSASSDGTNSQGFADYPKNFPSYSRGHCEDSDGENQPEAYFEFTLTQTEFVHFNTWGSGIDTVLYVIDRSTNKRVLCGDEDDWIYRGRLNSYEWGTEELASLRGRLAPGDYYLVVDSKSFDQCPSGYDHVTWTPDNGQDPGEACFEHKSNTGSWRDASRYCAQEEGKLAGFFGANKQSALSTQYPQLASDAFTWLGLIERGSIHVWDVNSTIDTSTINKWAPGEPPTAPRSCSYRTGGDEYFTHFCSSDGIRALNGSRLSADDVVSALCERPVNMKSSPPRWFLQVNAMNDVEPIGVPSWEDTMNSLNAGGYKAIGVDVSGVGPIETDTNGDPYYSRCDSDGRNPDGVRAYAHQHLQEAARRTGAVNSQDSNPWTSPYVIAMNRKGKRCHSGDSDLGEQVTDAILSLTQNIRQDVYLEAFDKDDGVDFDYSGPPGTVPQLSPLNIDEGPAPARGRPIGLFVDTVTNVPVVNSVNGSGDLSPDGVTKRCLDDPSTPAIIEQCIANTVVNFRVTFSAPSEIQLQAQDQIFGFQVNAMAGGAIVASKDVVIVVPQASSSVRSFNRDFDLTDVCSDGYLPLWGLFTWIATTPNDSKIRFFAKTAETASDLDSAPRVPLSGGFAVAARSAALGGMIAPPLSATGDTQAGTQLLDGILESAGAPQTLDYLRVEAELVPGTSGLDVPTLVDWKMQVSCPPGE